MREKQFTNTLFDLLDDYTFYDIIEMTHEYPFLEELKEKVKYEKYMFINGRLVSLKYTVSIPHIDPYKNGFMDVWRRKKEETREQFKKVMEELVDTYWEFLIKFNHQHTRRLLKQLNDGIDTTCSEYIKKCKKEQKEWEEHTRKFNIYLRNSAIHRRRLMKRKFFKGITIRPSQRQYILQLRFL